MVPVDLDDMFLETFCALLFEEFEVVVVREVVEGARALLWGSTSGIASYAVDVHGDRSLLEVVCVCELV